MSVALKPGATSPVATTFKESTLRHWSAASKHLRKIAKIGRSGTI
jgi:hypothetical protein